ncbi:hypothetical protein MKZ38_009795 [Zalerion maritima]|uniref:Pyridoxal phosphate homeostasis protein n=1 Tax=Zalerion maritima TaxID=339359 RepID=A0AAD5RYA5_9PEZI|nr:hypothetical protein MKZ38_009795 [Zalerion maritima]
MSETDMKVDAARAAALSSQLQGIQTRVAAVAGGRNVRLVAVSKLKPANDILALHQEPTNHEHFGENYAQELGQKAEMLPRSIKWHFIGGLQSGHCKSLAKIPNLFSVSSVFTTKHASLLEKARAAVRSGSPEAPILGIHVQVNTSGEENKSGCSPGAETVKVCKFVKTECSNLQLLGLMTIGAIARSMAVKEGEENEDFAALVKERGNVVKELGLEGEDGGLELSMGMSEDFEAAIMMGSSEVRVGSTIFGSRPPKSEAMLTV